MFTRKQYLDKECTYREYYAQFVAEDIKRAVATHIGLERIKNSKCEHFNNIPLKVWDRMSMWPGMKSRVSHVNNKVGVGNVWSLSDGVCMLKVAAQMIREGE